MTRSLPPVSSDRSTCVFSVDWSPAYAPGHLTPLNSFTPRGHHPSIRPVSGTPSYTIAFAVCPALCWALCMLPGRWSQLGARDPPCFANEENRTERPRNLGRLSPPWAGVAAACALYGRGHLVLATLLVGQVRGSCPCSGLSATGQSPLRWRLGMRAEARRGRPGPSDRSPS